MRRLFASEAELLRQMMSVRVDGGQALLEEVAVVEESHALKGLAPRMRAFNVGFLLAFVEGGPAALPEPLETRVLQALPHAIGAELFLTLDSKSKQPLLLHLLGGEAFTRRHFAPYIQRAQVAVSGAVPEHSAIQLHRARYCRILVVGDRICFLAADNVPPAPIGVAERVETESMQIDLYRRDGKTVCIDGWVQFEPPAPSEWRLVAVPREPGM